MYVCMDMYTMYECINECIYEFNMNVCINKCMYVCIPVQDVDPLGSLLGGLRPQQVRGAALHIAHHGEAGVAVLGVVVRHHDLAVLQLQGSNRRGVVRVAVAADRPQRHVEVALLPGLAAEHGLADGPLVEQEPVGDAFEVVVLGLSQRAGDLRLA